MIFNNATGLLKAFCEYNDSYLKPNFFLFFFIVLEVSPHTPFFGTVQYVSCLE